MKLSLLLFLVILFIIAGCTQKSSDNDSEEIQEQTEQVKEDNIEKVDEEIVVEKEKANPGLGNLCDSIECGEFCHSNRGRCLEYCDANPENPTCIDLFLSSSSTNTNFEDNEECEDTKVKFDYPPVNIDKTELLVPLGLMSGNHVTPVDHQYFQNFGNDEPNIEVYSPGDGEVRNIQYMSGSYFAEGEEIEWTDFRLEIQHTCTISSIYIHIDVLSEKIAAEAPEVGGYKSVRIPVKAGEIIGYYSNNVDYNLVDQELILPGLLIPEHYEREPWKIHVPETIEYFNEPVRGQLIDISLRTAEPISGKLDYDIDGKLIGNWFEEGTKGYAGNDPMDYASGHLSFAPEHIDPENFVISMGDYDGKEAQFTARGNKPDPATTGVEDGVVKYELVQFDYYNGDTPWDRRTLVRGLDVRNYDIVFGVVLVQMIEDRKLKFETFPGLTANEVDGFTSNAKIYER